MKLSGLFLCVLFFVQANAQLVEKDSIQEISSAQEFLSSISGPVFNDIRYVEAVGSAFHSSDWESGVVVTKTGKAYKDVPVRVDLVTNKIQYKSEDGQARLISAPLKEVKYTLNGKTVHFIQGEELPNKKTGWFQLLVNDQVSLVKSYRKTFEEKPSYGSNQLNIETTEFYFAYLNKTEHQIKKPSDLIALMPEKKAELEAEIKKTKSLGKDEQLVKVVSLLNSFLKS